jgi:CRISPR-associated Csx3 family protein
MKVVKIIFKGVFNVNDIKKLSGLRQEVIGTDAAVLTGRAPIWMYCAACHEITRMIDKVLIYDPKAGYVMAISRNKQP